MNIWLYSWHQKSATIFTPLLCTTINANKFIDKPTLDQGLLKILFDESSAFRQEDIK
jgi:hypothetical protein